MTKDKEKDMSIERRIAQFLDENLYSNTELFTEFIRTDTVEEQKAGSDLLLTTKDGKLNRSIIDEKVAAKYANYPLETFILELSLINDYGKKINGWFVNKNKTTEYYLFGWIIEADIPPLVGSKKYDSNKLTKDNIKKIEYAIVKDSDIKDYLEKKGLSVERLIMQAEEMREQGKKFAKINGIPIVYSDKLSEKPINVLLGKEILKKLSIINGIVER